MVKKPITTIRLERGLRLFRTSYRNVAGETTICPHWYVEFRDHRRIIRRLPAFTDRPQSEELARNLRKLVSWKVAGAMPDQAIAQWLEGLPESILTALSRWELLDGRRVAATAPIEDHLDAWKRDLAASRITIRQVEEVTGRARRVIDACKFKRWPDISASEVKCHLDSLRDAGEGIGAQTSNHYLGAIKQFCNWMVQEKRAATSPINHLQPLNVNEDRRHDRRALSMEEMRWLLAGVGRADDYVYRSRESPPMTITGDDRAIVYRLAVETGLRQAELRSLTRASFDLSGCSVTIAAKDEKRRKGTTLAIRSDTAAALESYLDGKLPAARALVIPRKDTAIRILRADLELGRKLWLDDSRSPQERQEREESDFLKYVDSRGLYADFHALRHTRGVWLFEHGGATPREAVELMRVSSLALGDRYTKSFRLADASVVNRGPSLSDLPQFQASRATGTNDIIPPPTSIAVGPRLARSEKNNGKQRSPDDTERRVEPDADSTKKPTINAGFTSGEGESKPEGF